MKSNQIFRIFILASIMVVATSNNLAVNLVFHTLGVYQPDIKSEYDNEYPPIFRPLEKQFYIPRHFTAEWKFASTICRTYGLEIAILETLEEFEAVSGMCQDFFHNSHQDHPYYDHLLFIGGATNIRGTKNEWRWVSDGKKVKYSMVWADDWAMTSNATLQDDLPRPRKDYCLALGGQNFQFKAASCDRESKLFICQNNKPYSVFDEPEEIEADIHS